MRQKTKHEVQAAFEAFRGAHAPEDGEQLSREECLANLRDVQRRAIAEVAAKVAPIDGAHAACDVETRP